MDLLKSSLLLPVADDAARLAPKHHSQNVWSIWWAARNGNFARVEELLERGTDINVQDSVRKQIHCCAFSY